MFLLPLLVLPCAGPGTRRYISLPYASKLGNAACYHKDVLNVTLYLD